MNCTPVWVPTLETPDIRNNDCNHHNFRIRANPTIARSTLSTTTISDHKLKPSPDFRNPDGYPHSLPNAERRYPPVLDTGPSLHGERICFFRRGSYARPTVATLVSTLTLPRGALSVYDASHEVSLASN